MSKLIAIIPAADYLYVSRFSSYEETRYYLNGVFVDVANKRLVATDGHRLGLLAMGDDDMHVESDSSSLILTHAKTLQAACKASRNEVVWLRCYDDKVEIIKHPEGAKAPDYAAWVGDVDMTFPGKAVYVDGTFPDYERIMPSEISGSVAEDIKGVDGKVTGQRAYAVNGKYLASFAGPNPKQQALKVLPNGSSPWTVLNTDDRFIGVLMPMSGGIAPADALARLADILKRSAPTDTPAESLAA